MIGIKKYRIVLQVCVLIMVLGMDCKKCIYLFIFLRKWRITCNEIVWSRYQQLPMNPCGDSDKHGGIVDQQERDQSVTIIIGILTVVWNYTLNSTVTLKDKTYKNLHHVKFEIIIIGLMSLCAATSRRALTHQHLPWKLVVAGPWDDWPRGKYGQLTPSDSLGE